ncbi:MAG: hypothetical protein KDA80_23330, partial [Planctomycetaceae bacterium]|nr:hypothetical protein [Planctomycetaceae bacterium]
NDLSPKIIQAQFTNTTDRLGRGHSPNWTLADQVALNERELLEQALKAHNNNRTKTAKALGLSRVGLYKKLRRLGLMDRKKEPSSVGS